LSLVLVGAALHRSPGVPAAAVAWAVMVVAMMLPTLVPMLRTLSELLDGRHAGNWWRFVGGYAAVWMAAGVVGVALHVAVGQLTADSSAASPRWLIVVALGVAGLYQYTPWKARCLQACTSPFLWFLRNWRDGARGSWVMGCRHGATCLGCCWALMALSVVAFGAGLAGMAAMTLVMFAEKVPRVGRLIRVPLGAALLVVALATLLFAGGNGPSHHLSLDGTPVPHTTEP
jgi:predicted metal-binding membrane protein